MVYRTMGLSLEQFYLNRNRKQLTEIQSFTSALEASFEALSRDDMDFLVMLTALGKRMTEKALTEAMVRAKLRTEEDNHFSRLDAFNSLKQLKKGNWIYEQASFWMTVPADFKADFVIGCACNSKKYQKRALLILEFANQNLLEYPTHYMESDQLISTNQLVVRNFYYLGKPKKIREYVFPTHTWGNPVNLDFTFRPFNSDRLRQLDHDVLGVATCHGLDYYFFETLSPDSVFPALEAIPGGSTSYFRIAADLCFLQGNFEAVTKWGERYRDWGLDLPSKHEDWRLASEADPLSWEATAEFWKGNFEEAIDKFEQSLKVQKGKSRKKKFTPRGLAGFVFNWP